MDLPSVNFHLWGPNVAVESHFYFFSFSHFMADFLVVFMEIHIFLCCYDTSYPPNGFALGDFSFLPYKRVLLEIFCIFFSQRSCQIFFSFPPLI